MCQQCIDAFDELWPELGDEDKMAFLWNCTAFPVGNNTREQLVHYLEKCGKDLPAIMRLSDQEMTAAMAARTP